MGNGVNSFGEKTYLKASERGYHTPLSQKNVHISPDYTDYLHMVLGSVPEWIIFDEKISKFEEMYFEKKADINNGGCFFPDFINNFGYEKTSFFNGKYS